MQPLPAAILSPPPVPPASAPVTQTASKHTHIPLFLMLGDDKIPLVQGKPLIDQVRYDTDRLPTKVDVSYVTAKDGTKEIHLSPFGSPQAPTLYCPDAIAANIDLSKLEGAIQFAAFAFVEDSDTGKILFIQRQNGSWYIPGGLVEPEDTTLWNAAIREVAEETGVTLSGTGKLMYLYNSIIPINAPTRQNLMGIYFAPKDLYSKTTLQIETNGETLDAKWFAPTEFWAKHLGNKKFSLPSIKYAFSHYVAEKFAKIFNSDDLKQRYNRFKEHFASGFDSILFDLCFLEVEATSHAGQDFTSLMEATVNQVKHLSRIHELPNGQSAL